MASRRQIAAARRNLKKAKAVRATSARPAGSRSAPARRAPPHATPARAHSTRAPSARTTSGRSPTRAAATRTRPSTRHKAGKRAKPGARATGRFFHVEVRPDTGFKMFRVQDVGEKGGIERVAGRRASGSWSTLKWLIGKELAHVEGRTLVADSADARRVLARLGSAPVRIRGDRFEARSQRNVSETDKPTQTQKRARGRNPRKAQATRRKRSAA